MKEALLDPPGMVTEAGTCATLVLLLLRRITAPVGGAAPFRVTVPVEDEPPVTVLGDRVKELSDATVMVSVAVRVTPRVAVIVAEVEVPTPLVVMVKVAVRLPAATVTLAGV